MAMREIELLLRGVATAAEIDGDPFCRLRPNFVREVADEIERLRAAVAQLAKDHPDTPVTWPHNGLTCYQDIHDWASFVLYGAAQAAEGGGDDPQPDPEMLRRSEADFAAGRARPIEDVIADIKAKAKGDWDG